MIWSLLELIGVKVQRMTEEEALKQLGSPSWEDLQREYANDYPEDEGQCICGKSLDECPDSYIHMSKGY